jgi:anoctamin-10
MQRPTPWRADTIGPWLDSLSFLTWLGSITTAALVYLFSNDGLGPDGNPSTIKGWALLLTIFFSEHVFLFLRWSIRLAISKLDSPGRQKERRGQFLVRKQYFEENLSDLKKIPKMTEAGGKVDRASLGEDARKASLTTNTVENRFWAHQSGWKETVQVGKGLIEKATAENRTDSKKEL